MKVSIQFGVAALLLVGRAQAGIYVENSTHDFATGKTTVHDTTYLQDGKLRSEDPDGRRITIFKNDTFFEIDRSTKTYEMMDKAAMAQMAGQMNNAFAKMKEKMAQMPPEQRAQMEKALGQMGNKPGAAPGAKTHVTDVVDIGGSGTAAGRSCHLWQKTRDGVAQEQFCVAPAGSLPGSDEAIALFKKMGEFFAEMQKAMQAQGGAAATMAAAGANSFAQETHIFNKMGGFPLATRHISRDGKLASTEDVVTKWQEQSIPPSQFEIPAGYTRKTRDLGLDRE